MKTLIPMDEFGMFADKNGSAKVDSLYVAKMFQKRHDNVLRDIAELDCSEEFRLLNFEESKYKNEQGHYQPCIDMTRDGFIFLVMGYRGKKAAAIKEFYIGRFNEMEALIKNLLEARNDFPLLTDNISLLHDEPKWYHFSNECDMINRIALGKTAKQIRQEFGLEDRQSIRPHLLPEEIELVNVLQKTDVGLLLTVSDFERRKEILSETKARWLQRKAERNRPAIAAKRRAHIEPGQAASQQ